MKQPALKGRSTLWRVLRIVALVLLAVLLLPYLITPLYAVIDPVSTSMLWRRLTGARVERQYVPITRISPSLSLAVIVAEDGRFCSHHGVDLAELREAFAEADDMDEMRGGSTITQQVAKNLFLWQGRSYVRKALEFPLALWIDLILSKRRVLEIYLNIAEWGPNGEFGAEAGSRRALANRPRTFRVMRGPCWPQPCQIRWSVTHAVQGRASSGWLASMWRGLQNRRLRPRVYVEATSVTASLPL